jgi:glucose/arabinose dehydrogenase
MKKVFIVIGCIIAGIAGLFFFFNPTAWVFAPRTAHEPIATTTNNVTSTSAATSSTNDVPTNEDPVQTVAGNLSVPWCIEFLPNGNLLVTERPGQLIEISDDGEVINEVAIDSTRPVGEGGLLGLALHPDFNDNRQLYLYETYESEGGTQNRVVRYRYVDGKLSDQSIIISSIPGARYHDGGRIAFGPDDRYLFITTGDAGNPNQAQSTSTLNGKVLKVNPDGSIPAGNPFGNAVYSYGHRNPQGLAWSQNGQLFATEHGRSGIKSGLDEVNLIKAGANYGWPYFEGDERCRSGDLYDPPAPESLSGERCNVVAPIAHSGPDITWAPASAAIVDETLFFGGLRGQAVYTASIQTGVELRLGEITAYFKEEFGRIRTVEVGPANEFLYVTTSNTDGRGSPQEGDDRLIRIGLDTFD